MNYFRPWSAPRPMVVQRNTFMTTQCNHSNGSGFWGGFLGGFLGTGLMQIGNLFGFGGMPMMGGMYGSMPMMGGYNPMGYLNQLSKQTDGQQGNGMATLTKFYGDDYNISYENGTYYARHKDGGAVISAGSFDEMIGKLGGTAPASQNPYTAEIEKLKAQALAAQNLGRLKEAQEEVQAFNSLPEDIRKGATIEVIIEEGDDYAQFKVTREDDTVFIAKTIAAVYNELGITPTDEPKNEDNTPPVAPKNEDNTPPAEPENNKPAGTQQTQGGGTGALTKEQQQTINQAETMRDQILNEIGSRKDVTINIISNPNDENFGALEVTKGGEKRIFKGENYMTELRAFLNPTEAGKWRAQEDPGFGKDQQFVAANGNIYEVIVMGHNNHLNTMWFNQSGLRDGTSISIKKSYNGQLKCIENIDTGKQFEIEYGAGGQDGNSIVVLVGDQKIPFEDFLNGNYTPTSTTPTESIADQIQRSGAANIYDDNADYA